MSVISVIHDLAYLCRGTPRGAAEAWHQGVSVDWLGQRRLIGCLAKRPLHQSVAAMRSEGDPKVTRRLFLGLCHLPPISSFFLARHGMRIGMQEPGCSTSP